MYGSTGIYKIVKKCKIFYLLVKSIGRILKQKDQKPSVNVQNCFAKVQNMFFFFLLCSLCYILYLGLNTL